MHLEGDAEAVHIVALNIKTRKGFKGKRKPLARALTVTKYPPPYRCPGRPEELASNSKSCLILTQNTWFDERVHPRPVAVIVKRAAVYVKPFFELS